MKILEGVEEYQALSIYHELMNEAVVMTPPSEEDRQAFVDQMVAKVATSDSFTEARKRSLHERLALAREQSVTGDVFYATQRIEERARRAKIALDDYYADTARSLGLSVQQVRNRLAASYEESKRERSLAAPADWATEFRRRPGRSGLPMDRHTAYAMWRLDTEIATRQGQAEARPVVTEHVRVNGTGVSAIGYDPETGRLEVEFRSRPGQYYAYRDVPADVHAEIMDSDHPTRTFNELVRNHADPNRRAFARYAYATQEEADAAAVQHRCASCGQFAGPGHGCPPFGSADEVAGMAARARTQAQVVRARRAVASGTIQERLAAYEHSGMTLADARARVEQENRTAEMSPDTTERHRRNQHLSARVFPYRGDSGTFRCTALSSVRRILAEEPRAHVPVVAHIESVAGPDGRPQRVPAGEVTGRVTVTHSPDGGYAFHSGTDPDARDETDLQCTCLEYRRNYDCVHVRQVLGDMTRRMNQDNLRQRHAIADAVAAVNAEAAADHAASVAAQAAAQEARAAEVVEVSYAEDMAAFQADYRAAKARLAAGEDPVPYLRENATGGLGAREGGRAFGLELEFTFPPHPEMSYEAQEEALDAIARDLYEAGLTSRDTQAEYGSARYRGYSDQHQGGWSFEEDGSVAGEIVSPIMYDEPETWENIEKVCEIVKRHGGQANLRTGSHVHVSTGDYDHTVENHNRLLGLFHENEDTIYRLATSPERGVHRAMSGNGYANPNAVPADGYTSVQASVRMNRGYVAINMEDTRRGASSDHVEYRVWDGTLSPSAIQAQVKISLAMTQAAFRDTDYTPGEHLPVGSTRAHNRATYGEQRRLTGEQWKADTEGVRTLADRLFTRREDKAQMAALFAVTKWQQRRQRRR